MLRDDPAGGIRGQAVVCHPARLLGQPCGSHTPFQGKWASDESQLCDVSHQVQFETHISEPDLEL